MSQMSRAVPGIAQPIPGLDVEALREAIHDEYSAVARHPEQGFHFHTGRPLARLLGYETHAAYVLDAETAGSIEAVTARLAALTPPAGAWSRGRARRPPLAT